MHFSGHVSGCCWSSQDVTFIYCSSAVESYFCFHIYFSLFFFLRKRCTTSQDTPSFWVIALCKSTPWWKIQALKMLFNVCFYKINWRNCNKFCALVKSASTEVPIIWKIVVCFQVVPFTNLGFYAWVTTIPHQPLTGEG